MNVFRQVAAKLKGKREEITTEVLAALFDEMGKTLDELNENYEVELIIPEIHVKVRLVDRKRKG